MLTETSGVIEGAGATGVVFCVVVNLGLKVWILASTVVGFFNIENEGHQGFCYKPSAKHSIVAGFVRSCAIRFNGDTGFGIQSINPASSNGIDKHYTQ